MRKPRHTPPVPRTSIWASTIRPGWTFFAEMGQLVLGVAAAVAVFLLAGGTRAGVDRFADTGSVRELFPVIAAVITFVAMGISDLMTGLVTRARHNRFVNDWYRRQHPEEVPTCVQVAHIGELLTAEGPMHPYQIREKLTDGGPWSGVPPLSQRGVLRALGQAGGRRPQWLADRKPGQPYSHVANPYQAEQEPANATT